MSNDHLGVAWAALYDGAGPHLLIVSTWRNISRLSTGWFQSSAPGLISVNSLKNYDVFILALLLALLHLSCFGALGCGVVAPSGLPEHTRVKNAPGALQYNHISRVFRTWQVLCVRSWFRGFERVGAGSLSLSNSIFSILYLGFASGDASEEVAFVVVAARCLAAASRVTTGLDRSSLRIRGVYM